jgi:hypothetical protein
MPLRAAWLVLAVVIIAGIMDLIDSGVANLAAPSIRADLGCGPFRQAAVPPPGCRTAIG